MNFSLDAFDRSCRVIQIAIDTFMLHEFISKVIILIDVIECGTHVASLFFATYFDDVIVFITIKALHDSTLFVKQFTFFELILKNQFFIN